MAYFKWTWHVVVKFFHSTRLAPCDVQTWWLCVCHEGMRKLTNIGRSWAHLEVRWHGQTPNGSLSVNEPYLRKLEPL